MSSKKHYTKYRVFREPDIDSPGGHPVDVMANYLAGFEFDTEGKGEVWEPLEEVTDGMFFVLRPTKDHHARVALAAYAASCAKEHPLLSDDLFDMLHDSGPS